MRLTDRLHHLFSQALFPDLPSAPDLDEIIGGSDEENDSGPEGHEELTAPELVKRLRFAWQNEKLAPELLVARPQLVGLVQEELERLEIRAKIFPKGDIKSQLILMQVDRLRYMLKDYLRTRIMKIQQYPEHIMAEERLRPGTEEPHLTAEEFSFAKTFSTLTMQHLQDTVLNHLPVNMQKLDGEQIAFHPNLDSYVFCQVNTRVDGIEVADNASGERIAMTLMPGEIHLLPYRCVRSHIEDRSLSLR
ncbi:hypothetical protein AAHC03_0547 [Spirometra sp. Aus1]